jgi:hypothetical protein
VGTAETVWERVDLPLLRFVAELDYSMQWQFDRGEPTDELPALTGEELDAALRRLEEHGLIAAGGRTETIRHFVWWRLRPTPTAGYRGGTGPAPWRAAFRSSVARAAATPPR